MKYQKKIRLTVTGKDDFGNSLYQDKAGQRVKFTCATFMYVWPDGTQVAPVNVIVENKVKFNPVIRRSV